MSPSPFIRAYSSTLHLSDYADLSKMRQHLKMDIVNFLRYAEMSITKQEEVSKSRHLHALLLVIKKVTFALNTRSLFIQGYRFNLLSALQTKHKAERTQLTLRNILYDPSIPITTISMLVILEKKKSQAWKRKMQTVQEHLHIIEDLMSQITFIPKEEFHTEQGQQKLAGQLTLLTTLTLDL